MPVWIPVRVRSRHKEVVTSAKVNTAFTLAPAPLIRLPEKLARELGFEPLKEESRVLLGVHAGGGELRAYVLGPVEVKVDVPDKETPWKKAWAVLMGGNTVLLNDYLTEELGVEPVKPRSGYWRLSNDPPSRLRESAKEEIW